MKAALLLIFLLTTSFAHGGLLDDAGDIINASVPCNQLTNSQLEMLGDYYMEQMHPGTAHQLMDKMMGGAGSPQLESMHVQMARNIYCGETTGYGMMGAGMMGAGMMGGAGSVMNYLYVILVIGIIILIYVGIYKLIKGGINGKKERN